MTIEQNYNTIYCFVYKMVLHCALPAVYPQLRFATVSSLHALDASAYCLAAGICSQAVIFYQALMKIVSLLVLAGKCYFKCCYCNVSSGSAAEHCKPLCCCCRGQLLVHSERLMYQPLHDHNVLGAAERFALYLWHCTWQPLPA